MKNVSTSTKGAENATVLGNGVANNAKKEEAPILLLPVAPMEKEEPKKEEQAKAEKGKVKSKNERNTEPILVAPKRLSIDELTDKADRIYLLRQKYQEVREKRKQLESFTISHDNSNAQLTLVDAKGLSISTGNPISINKLLSDWMLDLNNHLIKVEKEIRTELDALN